MSYSTRTSELLVGWWNFSDAGVCGRALSARRVDDHSVEVPKLGQEDPLGLFQLISVRLEEGAMETSSTKSPKKSHHRADGLDTFLGMWIQSISDHTGIDEFATELYDLSSVYELVLESGKSFRTGLASLCSIRLAAVLLRRPNPLFYLPPTDRGSRSDDSFSIVFDPRFLLPIPLASQYRRALLAANEILVSKHHLFLFGNYLPELVGKAVLDDAPLSTAHARVQQRVRLASDADFAPEPKTNGSTGLANSPIVRWVLLGVARVLKSLLSGSHHYGDNRHRVISSLLGPWSSQPTLGKPEYRHLKRLSRGGVGST